MHDLRLQEDFDVTCIRLDDAFVNWANTTYGATWDGTLVGTLGGYTLETPQPGFNLFSGFDSSLGFTLRFFDDDIGTWPIGSLVSDNPVVGFLTHHGGTEATHGRFGIGNWDFARPNPIRDQGGPIAFTIRPCDLINPPAKVNFNWVFATPDGFITESATILYPPLHAMADTTWKRIFARWLIGHYYRFDFTVTVSGSDTWATLGISRDNDAMGFAEFDMYDNPTVPPSPVGVMIRGNAHGLDGLPAGVTFQNIPGGTDFDAYLFPIAQ